MNQIYLNSIYKVQDYIENHLYETLNLEKLATISGFSKFHFHRIFKSILNEPLTKYINRIKFEKSKFLLSTNKYMNITDVAYHCGFSDSSTFSRAFKNYYGINPNLYRKNYSKNCKEPYKISQYNEYIPKAKCKNLDSIKGNISIVDLDEINAFYIRHIGSYRDLETNFPNLIKELFIQSNKISNINRSQILVIYHDHPEFTNKDNLKTSLCMPIINSHQANTVINTLTISSGKYVVGHFEIFQDKFNDAWDFMYKNWLLNSKYKPADMPPFEMYVNNPDTHPLGKHIVNIYLPIESF